jgi:hypothetical protein
VFPLQAFVVTSFVLEQLHKPTHHHTSQTDSDTYGLGPGCRVPNSMPSVCSILPRTSHEGNRAPCTLPSSAGARQAHESSSIQSSTFSTAQGWTWSKVRSGWQVDMAWHGASAGLGAGGCWRLRFFPVYYLFINGLRSSLNFMDLRSSS